MEIALFYERIARVVRALAMETTEPVTATAASSGARSSSAYEVLKNAFVRETGRKN